MNAQNNRWRPAVAVLTSLLGTLTACGGGGADAGASAINATESTAGILAVAPSSAKPMRLVSTPNPNVFPLLLAKARNPSLPVQLLAVATGADIDTAFAAGDAEALLSMTYTAAQKVTSGKVPELQLAQSYFWRGFWQVSPSAAGVKGFADLVGKGVLVSQSTELKRHPL